MATSPLPMPTHARLMRRSVLAVALLAAASCAPSTVVRSTASLPTTRAERSGYTETSTYADVIGFLDTLDARVGPLVRGAIGRTTEGREIPYVIASRPSYSTPEAVRRSGRPVVYVQGNIHAGEVEGKEALQALLRDLLASAAPNVLDSIVLIAVPIYNADGNERFDRQARNRGAQNGPEMVGQRPNAAGLDLNRDYIKAEAPETRGSLAMFNVWDPHVFVDLHTTNGSYHGYNLTWANSLNPAAELPGATFGGAYARDSLLPVVQQRMAAKHKMPIFPYGNFASDEGRPNAPRAWLSYDHRPRFGTNYYALRGRVAVLSEAYSHDPFETRVKSTYHFVSELLSAVAERGSQIVSQAAATDLALSNWDRRGNAPRIPVRSSLTKTPRLGDVIYEVLERTTDSTRREPGVRAGMRRTGRYVTERMPINDRFTPDLQLTAPWGYAIPASDTAVINLLKAHGVIMYRSRPEWTGNAGEQYAIDSMQVAPRPFQGRREVRLHVRRVPTSSVSVSAGSVVVPVSQPLGVLAIYLLEPESDDGVVNWDVGGKASARSREFLVTRFATDPRMTLDRFLQ